MFDRKVDIKKLERVHNSDKLTEKKIAKWVSRSAEASVEMCNEMRNGQHEWACKTN
ncbi:hypothetical protein HanRHA438_Chr17g0797471 [Helianthus annuus]|nr:hypothetical protein HanRHA438_Chr17g0797471 [Helianthus annuus]